ncbi:hypothetical protein SD70_00050 [Gordoniibacillus kamchatkensis]|uniref:Uncharacterized protein n=1 Tax=Gordoniibacillus kamchatkensis TaxID=1590651 RepID=A0ABR5AMZ5_9BACL|nr:hypothetical protein [Paenibacillus sp. VKM B-2647]KIL42379.1 hypothetical protein SD70_00050 [Paenibacillus sp. VKM B-2647]
MKGLKNVIYMSVALGMLFYAVPRLDLGQGLTAPAIFGVVWICFALLVVAAHLHAILGVDEETREELGRIGRMKKWQLEKTLQGKSKQLQFRK